MAVAFSTSGSSLVQYSSLQGLTDACDLNKATISSWISGLNSSAIITDFPSAVAKALAFFTSNSATGNVCRERGIKGMGRGLGRGLVYRREAC